MEGTSIYAPVRRRRLARDWTAEDLARRSGLSAGTVRAVEHGRQRPSFGTLKLLALALECHPDELIDPTNVSSLTAAPGSTKTDDLGGGRGAV